MSNCLRDSPRLVKLKGFERNWLMPVSRHCLGICWDGLSRTTENISQDSSQYLSQDLNWTPPKLQLEVQNFRLRSLLFWDDMQCKLVICYPTFWNNIPVPCSSIKQSKKNARNRWMCEYVVNSVSGG